MEIPRLHPDTVEEVKQRADIVDVVSEHVVLRKRGKDYIGLCPFHDEKSPSFSVSPTKQLYYCFGCNAGGTAIKFLMEVGKRSFSDVVLDLARRYQVSVQTLEPEQRQELQRQLSLREQLYEILAIATEFYKHVLQQPLGQHALTYLQQTRGLTEETIQQFQLGYAPAGWATIYKYLVEQKGKPVQQVEQAGLIVPRKEGNGYYDRFRDRLIIPIRDTQGRVIGFGGRSLGDEQPKYLNSPETELFDKGKTLFALDKARDSISKQDQAVVVEGYFDAIALHAAGISNVVASMGTALSLGQVRQLLRYTESKQIVLNFDADAAGTNASIRAIGEIANLAYQGQVQLRVLNLPDGKDADEFLKGYRDAAEKYRKHLQSASLWIDWQINQLLIGKDLKQANQFQQVAEQMVKLLSKIDNNDARAHYVRHCGEVLSRGDDRLVPLRVEYLFSQIKRQGRPGKKVNNSLPPLKDSSERNLLEQAEALLLRIYLHCPEYRQTIIDTLEAQDLLFSLSHHRFLWQQILELQAHERFALAAVPARLYNDTPDPLISLLQDRSLEFPDEIAAVAHLFHLDERRQEDLVRAPLLIRAAAACLEKVSCEKHRRYCLEQWQKLDPSTDLKRREYYWQELYAVTQRILELDQLRQFNLSDIIGSATA
ncbi:DNA primase [Microcoleus sp. FACHB-SPT15]|uniref:DNA primase n=1 Tax=Microcoleus sp. FACHB-SPT15 TaxID=2692830 RepID=UPI001782F73C|nr:DNA primase [Microcoleus sp. FACHB-SPT15]MBD1805216.1 DNA primase [Microcoleus sp. FACHB-SPT15]